MKKIVYSLLFASIFFATEANTGPIGSSGSSGSGISGLTTGNLPVAASSTTLGDSGIAAMRGTANNLAVTGGSTTNPVSISATGSDSNIPLKLIGKGYGGADIDGPITILTTSSSPLNLSIPNNYYTTLANTDIADVNDGGGFSNVYGLSSFIYTASGGTQSLGTTALVAQINQIKHRGTGDLSWVTGYESNLVNASTGHITGFMDHIITLVNTSGPIEAVYGLHAGPVTGSGTIGFYSPIYLENQTGFSNITYNYDFWANSPGVRTITAIGKSEYYNPGITKYVAGAANYERIIEQWNSNVAEIGTEAGGTGTQRVLRLLGATVEVPSLTASRAVCTDASKNLISTCTSANLRNSVTDELGTGALLFDGATPTGFVLTNATGLPIATGVSGLGANVATLLGQASPYTKTVHILKPANESVSSSTTLQNDDDLKYTLAANEVVSFEFVGFIESTSTIPDFKYAIVAPSGATGVYSVLNNDPTTANLQYWFARTNFDGSVADGTASINGVNPFSVKGTVTNGSTPGELKIQWAQNTSSATAVAVKQGSMLIVWTH